jgi:RHS repeat-associated protein
MSGRNRLRRAIAAPLTFVLAVTIVTQVLPEDAAAAARTPKPKDVTGVDVRPVAAKQRPVWTAGDRELTVGDVHKPQKFAGEQVVDLSTSVAQAGRLPVRVRSAATASGLRSAAQQVGKVKVGYLDTAAAGIKGIGLRLSRADGVKAAAPATVTVDYRALAGVFTGDAMSRLRLMNLTDGTPIPAKNDTEAGTLTATLMVAAAGSSTTVGVAAAAEGDTGDYKATSLSAASTWQVSQQTGSFSWAYPIKMAPGAGSFTPSLSLDYNSASIDGRTAGTNTQGSWAGDGWDLWPGYIERSYRSCPDDRDVKEKKDPNNADARGGDLCYFDDNATISFNGGATELVKVASSDSGAGDTNVEYRGATDDGSKIELLRDGRANGDADGTYWRETTTDGTQYYFGRSSSSAFTAPVYSNHSGEPGYDKDFTKSRNTRAWRWNLDYAVDPSGNTITYSYAKETGAYAREGDEDKRITYDRGGYLTRIDYGSRKDDDASAHPAAQVVLGVGNRCQGTCFDGDEKPIPAAFPDTPWDQYCDAAPCKTQFSPTFWTGKRLTDITTKVYSGTGDDYTPVDSWHLDHTYLSAGGNNVSPMWLKTITHKGLTTSAGGPAVTDPPVTFDANADLMPNRVDTAQDGHSSLYRSRIIAVNTEAGAQIGVSYSKPECSRSALPKQWANTSSCFPQYYGAEGETPTLDWFNKYRVTRIDLYDNTGGFVHQQTNYDYLDQPAWAYDDSALIKPKKRTWGQYRGYGRVRVRQGLESGTQSATEYRYFRGMDGDKQPNANGDLPPTGTARSVVVEDSLGTKLTDHESFAGMLRESIVYNGVGGDWVSGQLDTPEHLPATAVDGTLQAWPTHTKQTRTRFKLANATTRWTTSETTFDTDNYPVKVNDLGDEATDVDDKCTTIEYVRNRASWILGTAKRTLTVGLKCVATSTNADILADTRTWYDDPDVYGKEPTHGLPKRVDELDSWTGTTANFVTRLSTYDAVGRTKSVTDPLGRITSTAYTPPTGGPLKSTVVTDPLGNTITTTLDPGLGVPLATTDINGATVEMKYDGDGRLLKVWAPGRSSTASPNSPNASFDYQLRNTASSTVTTKVLTGYGNAVYRTSVSLLDGLLRERQTQTQTANGGRAIVDTVYNSRGLLDWTSVPYYDLTNAAPSTELVTPDGRPEVPAQTTTVYDGAGRLIDAIFEESQTPKWRTHTVYAGEKTSVTPPLGGTATTTIADAAGRTVELRQYKDPKNVGSDVTTTFDKATYVYNRQGLQSQVKDPGNNTWSYEYDLHGRPKLTNDPDKGKTAFSYDAAGHLETTTDNAGRVIAYTYDAGGRKTTQRQNSINGPRIAEWFYDKLAKGQGRLAKSVRYEPAGSTNEYVTEVAGYDNGGRPTGATVTVPSSETGLCVGDLATPCSYTVKQSYNANGDPYRTTFPAVAGLEKEELETSYNTIGLVDGAFGVLRSGNVLYASTDFNQLDDLIQQTLGDDINRVTLVRGVDEQTRRTTSFEATPLGKADIYNLSYKYDDYGNVLNIADKPDGAQPAETQCFTYDYLRRLTEAWTPSSQDCKTAPTVAGLGGPAKYWNSYTFDTAGNRKTEKIHGTTDTTRTYAYPTTGGVAGSKPHAATQVVTTTGTSTTATRTENYQYDENGNMKCRPAGTATDICPGGTTAAKENQALTWTDDGRVAKTTDKTGDTTYLYDADGNRLIRRDPTGSTLYLPGGTEVRKPKTGTAVGTRYYSSGGSTIAVRTGKAITWMVTDHHGTASATVSNDDLQTVNRQRTLPFGNNRGTNPTAWVGDKGFVGGTKDNTGLTHLGAREYDPSLGSFISVDPLMDLADPSQWNGYSYANQNPINNSDPNGLSCKMEDGTQCGPAKRTPPAVPKPKQDDDDNSDGSDDGSAVVVNGDNVSYVCITGYLCLDSWQVRNFEGFINAYNAEIARLRALTHRDDLAAVQYAMALVGACGPKEENCDGQAFRQLENIANEQIVQTHEQGHPSSWAVTVGVASLSAVAGLPACLLSGSGRRSFAADTPVLLADGTTKPIEDIRVGDRVIATDPETGAQGSRVVTAVWVHQDDLYTLTVGGRRLATTEDHPFWDVTDHRWERADELDRGDSLRTPDGRIARVDGFSLRHGHRATAYNLTVNNLHTYYVLAGKTPVLVHNCGNSNYEAGGKHGSTARGSVRGTNSAEPSNGQGALDNSIEWTPEGPGQAPRRIGVSDGEIVILDRTRQASCGCSVEGGVNDIWHGHVRSWEQLSPGMQSAVRKGGLVDRKGRPLS